MQTREELITTLKDHIVAVTFTKANGEVRRMLCTLKEGHLPVRDASAEEHSVTSNPDTCVVWDLDKNGWRSFRVDSVLEVEGV